MMDTPLRLSTQQITDFIKFCDLSGIKHRSHSGWPTQTGWQIQHNGHWMALVWNKQHGQYTVDRRLVELFNRSIT